MAAVERPLKIRRRLVSAGTEPTIITTDPVPRGELWRVNRYAWSPETDQLDRARSYIRGHGYDHYIREWVAPANPFLYVDDVPVLLGESESLALTLDATDSGDVISLYVTGIILLDPDINQSSHLLPQSEE